MSKFNLARVMDICKDACVEYTPKAPYQFTRRYIEYICIDDIYAWGQHYGIDTDQANRLYHRHKDQMLNIEDSIRYAKHCAEALQEDIGVDVDFDFDNGLLQFYTERLTQDDLEGCSIWGELLEVSIVNNLLYVKIQIK